jgi:hypothetical protein
MKILTTWSVRTYDVWGNKTEGYEVNDVFTQGNVDIQCVVETHNIGTPNEFKSAYPSDYALKRVFGVGCAIDTDGDDLTIYVNRRSDGYQIGELHCLSHESLSPIRAKQSV